MEFGKFAHPWWKVPGIALGASLSCQWKRYFYGHDEKLSASSSCQAEFFGRGWSPLLAMPPTRPQAPAPPGVLRAPGLGRGREGRGRWGGGGPGGARPGGQGRGRDGAAPSAPPTAAGRGPGVPGNLQEAAGRVLGPTASLGGTGVPYPATCPLCPLCPCCRCRPSTQKTPARRWLEPCGGRYV